MSKKVAFVTGASRGIGKSCAIELAAAGFDVAVMARTVAEGEQREHSSTVKASDTTSLPGSLRTTAELIEQEGANALVVPGDLLDPVSLGVSVTTVLQRWDRIDVVVHNGRYVGPGHMDRFLDTPIELLEKHMQANLFAPLIINKLVIPTMVAEGGGTIVNITSSAAYADPIKPAGEGGWGMGYGISKGAFHRVAGILAAELAYAEIRCFNVQPGLIATERMVQDMAKFGLPSDGAPMEVMGKVVRWLCTDPEASAFNGRNIEAQHFCHERGLLPGWPGPKAYGSGPPRWDRSGAIVEELEAELVRSEQSQ
jgi:NAD(P)-dependent dehydrogenase (short-subunit alcohol dehydrogenase family)